MMAANDMITSGGQYGHGSAHAPETPFQWRFPLAFPTVPAVFLVVGLTWFPEPPRQLVENDCNDEVLCCTLTPPTTTESPGAPTGPGR